MPSIFTPTPSETERKEPGIGGKPPVDRRPTGGGGGGGDDEWKNERRGPRELLNKVRFFVLSGLAADMIFFAVLVLFLINLLVMGWSVALGVIALILRHGSGAEPLAWGVLFGLAPFSAVFYPVSVLPASVRPVLPRLSLWVMAPSRM